MRDPTEARSNQELVTAKNGYRLSLVIPAWNEAETIQQAIREAQAALSVVATEYEIIVVDDGSTDETAKVVRAEAAIDPHVRFVQHPRNLGYGAALRTGFQAATLDLVAFTDADCQFDLTDLSYMLPLTERYDISCGCRINRQDPARRRFFSWGYNTLVTLLMGSPVHDIDCALKIFHREKLASILPDASGFFVNTEMLTQARLQGLSIVEVGVHHRRRQAGESKVSLRDIPKTLSSLLPFWWTNILFPARGMSAADTSRGAWLGGLCVALVAAVLLFTNLSFPLLEPDEGRYAEIGREMLVSGDWIVPTLNDKPYLDKPPLFYWLLASSFWLFGTTEEAARLVPAVSAFLTVVATFWFGKRVIGVRAATVGAVVLALMAGFVHCGRFLILDSLLTLFVSVSMFAGHEAIRGERFRWFWWIASAICCALGVLTKGPIALVLLVPPLVGFAWLNRSQVRARLIHWCFYMGLVAALFAPWFIAICARNPEFAYTFLVDHHLKRFLLSDFHPGPFWFYIPVLLVGLMPWTLLLPPFCRFVFSRSADIRALRSKPMGFFLLWAGWCVLFFSLSRGKLPPYILPAVPAIALLLGCFIERGLIQMQLATSFREARAIVPKRTIMILCGVWVCINVAAWIAQVIDPSESAIEFVETGICIVCMTVVGFWGHRIPLRVAWAGCFLIALGFVFESTHEFVPAWTVHRSLLNQPKEAIELLRDEDTAVAVCEGQGSVQFKLNRNNVRNFHSPADGQLRDYWQQHTRMLLVVELKCDLATVRQAMPADYEIINVVEGRRVKFVLMQLKQTSKLATR